MLSIANEIVSCNLHRNMLPSDDAVVAEEAPSDLLGLTMIPKLHCVTRDLDVGFVLLTSCYWCFSSGMSLQGPLHLQQAPSIIYPRVTPAFGAERR